MNDCKKMSVILFRPAVSPLGQLQKSLLLSLRLLHICVVVFITKVKTGSVLSRHFSPCFDHVLLYYYRDTFEFSQGHVTKNQPMAVPVYEDNNSV